MIGLPALAKYVSADPRGTSTVRCELCSGPLEPQHRHVVELGKRGVQCACRACGILFSRGEPGGHFRTIPDRFRTDPNFGVAPERWSELGIPVSLAICHRDSVRGQAIISYPGPAGLTEAELEADVWEALRRATPLADELEPDVEALLVCGVSHRGPQAMACYLVPISSAYELVGRLRGVWEGFGGGARADAELAAFLAELEVKGVST